MVNQFRNRLLRGLSVFFLLGILVRLETIGAVESEKKPPNVILILVDDLGWTEVGFMGAKFYETPNIDQLAKESIYFTDAYSACTVCSPSRAALLTGKYPARLHITDWIPGHDRPAAKLLPPNWLQYLPVEEPNIARTLKQAGYSTANIGKWHLGEEPYWPENQGFDLNIGGCSQGAPRKGGYFPPYQNPRLSDGPNGEFLSDRLTTETIDFIKKNQDRPFFIYLPHYGVHTPLAGKPEVIQKYKEKLKAGKYPPKANPTYAALIESVDDSLGRIRESLKTLGLSEQTIIMVTSDNGSHQSPITQPIFHGDKGSSYEGGVRVPLVIHWPGVTQPGIVSSTPVIGMDLYPTILAMTGVKDVAGHILDGVSLETLLRGAGDLAPRALYWHYPHYHPGGATPYTAIREGDFRMIQFQEDGHKELYNIREDISEKKELSATMPEKATSLEEKIIQWRQQVGAQMAVANPEAGVEGKGKKQKEKKKSSETADDKLENEGG